MWSELRSEGGQTYLRSNPTYFYETIFGGADRIARLRRCLTTLTEAGATLLILSNGIEDEIEAALEHIGLRACFALVLGSEAQMQYGTADAGKPALLAMLASGAVATGGAPEVGGAADHVIFIDDDMDNYPGGGSPSERQCWTLTGMAPSADGIVPTLVAWPVVPAEGMSDDAMSRLETLLGAGSGGSLSAPPSPPS